MTDARLSHMEDELDKLSEAVISMAQEMLYDRWGRMVHGFVDGQVISIKI